MCFLLTEKPWENGKNIYLLGMENRVSPDKADFAIR